VGVNEVEIGGFSVPVSLQSSRNIETEFINSREMIRFENELAQPSRSAVDAGASRVPVVSGLPDMSLLQRRIARLQDDVTDEITALAHWQYVGNENLQSLLRSGNVPNSDRFRESVSQISQSRNISEEQVIAKLSERARATQRILDDMMGSHRLQETIVVYRGVGRDSINSILGDDFYRRMIENPDEVIGATWSDKGYFASTINPATASVHSQAMLPNVGAVIRMEVPEGTSAIPVSAYIEKFQPEFFGEYEILLNRGLEFEVIGITTPNQIYQAKVGAGLTGPDPMKFWSPESGGFKFLPSSDSVPIVHVRVRNR
jgi:hypothetical protein